MQEDLVTKLTSFGFTVNQAKVYLNIIQCGKTRVGQISKNTLLHRQDIYKLLPKLERMGLITRTIDKPFMVKAIPIEKALETLIFKEKARANRRISHLENNLKEMVNAIQSQPEIKDEARFTLLTSDEAIKNKGRFIAKKLKKDFKLVTSMEYITKPATHHFRDFMQTIVEKNAKIKLVIVASEDPKEVKSVVDIISPSKGQFRAKLIGNIICKDYQIIDNKEVWISTQQKTETGNSCLLWTNDSNIVNTYIDNFKKTWAQAEAIALNEARIVNAYFPRVNKTVMSAI